MQVEAISAYKGIGLVKLMGRQSGFITVQVGGQILSWSPGYSRGASVQASVCAHAGSHGHTGRPAKRRVFFVMLCTLPPLCLVMCTLCTLWPLPQASLAAGIVDAVLIPEVHFTLDGEGGLLAYLAQIMEAKARQPADLAVMLCLSLSPLSLLHRVERVNATGQLWRSSWGACQRCFAC
jgi:hypothetical protein